VGMVRHVLQTDTLGGRGFSIRSIFKNFFVKP